MPSPVNASSPSFSRGDRVIHPNRPEWGAGSVVTVDPVTRSGRRTQRLGVRFDRAGLKTIFTDVANLRPADQPGGAASSATTPDQPASQDRSWVDELEGPALAEKMAELPDAATDPFRPLSAQLKASLEQARFSGDPASVMDWASIHTGLADPLSRFNRHELEEHFRRFQRALEKHLRSLVEKARRSDPQALDAALRKAPPRAREMVKRLDARR